MAHSTFSTPATQSVLTPTHTGLISCQLSSILEQLSYFLVEATHNYPPTFALRYLVSPDITLYQFILPSGEPVSRIRWLGLDYISSTDVIRILSFRFLVLGRRVKDSKQFEIAARSMLRNCPCSAILGKVRFPLTADFHANTHNISLREQSELVHALYAYGGIRTRTTHNVFAWSTFDHNRLFLDLLDKDLSSEPPTDSLTVADHLLLPSCASQDMNVAALSAPFSPQSISHNLSNISLDPPFLNPTPLASIQQIVVPQPVSSTEKKPDQYFQCTRASCTRSFARRERLQQHLQKHDGIKPFQCSSCLNLFTRSDNLRKHVRFQKLYVSLKLY